MLRPEEKKELAAVVVTVIKAATASVMAEVATLRERNAALEAKVLELEARALIPGPQGEKGIQGEPGLPGATGPQGPAGADGPAGPPGPQGERGERGAEGPAGAHGAQGLPGRDGLPGVPGATGPQGEKGLDGLNGKDGAPGKDGRDGTADNLAVKDMGDGTWALCFKDSGEPLPGDRFRFPGVPKWHGTFDQSKEYEPGALVRWGRKVYVAKMPGNSIVPGQPGISQAMWDIFSEEGRQGKTGERGEKGETGPRGDKGDRGPERW